MSNLIIDFVGWVKCDAKSARFVRIGSEFEDVIDGERWLSLDEESRIDYVLEDILATQRDAIDSEYEHVKVFSEDSDE